MGVHRNFSRGVQRRHFAYLFQVADVATQTDVHKTLYCFWITKKVPHESIRSIHIYFEIFFKWICVRICHKGVLSGNRHRFCWIGAYSHNWVRNGPELSTNTGAFAVLSLVCAGWTELTSKYFVRIIFYTLPIRDAFSFHKLPNVHVWEYFLQISHNLRTINSQINISDEKPWNLTFSQNCFKQLEMDLYLDTTGQFTKIRTPRRHTNWVDELWKLASVNIALHLVHSQKPELSLNDYHGLL